MSNTLLSDPSNAPPTIPIPLELQWSGGRRQLYSDSKDRLVSRGLADLVGPGVDDRFAVDFIEVRQDPRLEFGLRGLIF